MKTRLPATERQIRKLRKGGFLDACEDELRANGIKEWTIEQGGNHACLVFEDTKGIRHRYPIPGSGVTNGSYARANIVGNLRRKLRFSALASN